MSDTVHLSLEDEALARLGVTREAISRMPQITPQLREIQRIIRNPIQRARARGESKAKTDEERIPYGPGSDILKSWPDYLEQSGDVEAARVLDVYYSVPRYLRKPLSIEAYCCAAGVIPSRVLELLTGIIVRRGVQSSSIIAAVNHPRVVQKTVEMALTDGGIEDRTILHKHAGFLPAPAGQKTSIVVTQNASAQANAAAAVAAPPPEQTIRRLADRFNVARQVEASKPAELPQQASTTPVPTKALTPTLVEAELIDEHEDES